jgi:hypothetical protein
MAKKCPSTELLPTKLDDRSYADMLAIVSELKNSEPKHRASPRKTSCP